jgi:hypothetical protein
MERAPEETAAELEQQATDEIDASLAALEKAMLGSPSRNREAIHELGCRIVAQALDHKTPN